MNIVIKITNIITFKLVFFQQDVEHHENMIVPLLHKSVN